MATIKQYLDYAELAQASYVNGLQVGMKGNSYGAGKNNIFVKADEFTELQATNFSNRYEVKAIADPYLTGLDAVLFYDTVNHKYVLSIRGTTPGLDFFSDLLLTQHGVAYDQYLALNNYYNQWVLDGIIPIGAKLDVTGHSLGGALAQTFAAAHPDAVDNVYSYNAPGIGGLTNEAYEKLGIIPSELGKNNVFNIYAKEGVSVTSGLGTMLGTVTPVSIDDGYLIQNHSIARLTNSLHIYNMLSSIANTQDINLLTSILEKTTNEKVVSIISDVFEDQVSGSTIDKAIELTKQWSGDAEGIVSMVDKNISQLQSKSIENLYALINLNSFALKGDYLPGYKNINPNDYSDIQLVDRAEFFYNHLHDITTKGTLYRDIKNGITNGVGENQVIFGTDNLNNSYQLQGGSGNDRIYGLGGNDEMVGNAGNDYMEGGTGSDTLHGGADYDVLLGGADTDFLYGYARGAHLHFVVYKATDGRGRKSIPVKFKSISGTIINPIVGRWYQAAE